MILAISLVVLSTSLAMLQFWAPSWSLWRLAQFLGLALIGLSVFSIIEQDRERQFTIASLERIGTHVNWEKSDTTIDLLNEPASVTASNYSVQAKLISTTNNSLPPQALRILKESRTRCTIDERWKYGYLTDSDAELLFMAFEKDGAISINSEREAGIEHIFYRGAKVSEAPLGSASVSMAIELAPNAQTRFASLNDLNGSVLIALLQAGPAKDAMMSAVSFNIESNAGRQLLHIPLRLVREGGIHGRTLAFSGRRFVGICIPDGFFGITRSRG
jgi:hypothetical protein